MSFLELETGDVIFEQKGILQEVKIFYERLYSERQVVDADLDALIVDAVKLNQEEKDQLEGPLTYAEACRALKNMKNNKSPGSDGYTVEFYKFFFVDIGVFLVRSANEGFQTGKLSVSQRQGVIVCIPKDEKPKQFLKNWRPISLLNTAYKITSSAIAGRLKSVLPKLIHEDQKGFMKGRYIGDNIRKIYDLLLYTEKENIPGLIISADIEKAFDSVSWSFLYKALKFFNFGPGLIQWIHTMYNDIVSCVSVNGQYSNWFNIKRGVRQGDPCSAYLYLICAEILAIFIRQNEKIKGIEVDTYEVLLSQFADDTNFCLDGSEESFRECVKVLNCFSEMSGLTLNKEKTSVIWIGSMKNSNVRFLRDENFCWNPGIFKILGIVFSTDLETMVERNMHGKIFQVRKLLNQWSKRNLTPLGKITVLKTLILSKFTYLFLNLPDPPLEVLDELQNVMFKFLWNDKRAKIKKSVVCKPYVDGGLSMVDVYTYVASLKISWLNKIKNDNNLQLFIFGLFPALRNVSKFGEEYVDVCLRSCTNPFWTDVLKHYKKLCIKCTVENATDFLAECIHYNVNIRRDGKVVLLKEWIQNEVLFVNQLYNMDSGRFFTFAEFKNQYPQIMRTDFLLYSGVIKAIQQYSTRNDICFDETVRFTATKVWTVIAKGSKEIKHILLRSTANPTAVSKWNNVFENLNWKDIFLLCFKPQEVKLRWFQARILHRILPTRKYLHMCKIVEDPLCNLCNEDIQTIEHLMWTCSKVKLFWSSLERLLQNCAHCSRLQLSEELILFGCKTNVVTDCVFDYILLLAKFFIYQCYLNDNLPLMSVFLNVLKSRYVELKYLSCIMYCSVEFQENWSLYQNIL
jgi:hypothetical protein